jgi:hypothetical protein
MRGYFMMQFTSSKKWARKLHFSIPRWSTYLFNDAANSSEDMEWNDKMISK